MRCALVDVANNVIQNVIVADPAVDVAPNALMLLAWVPDYVNPGDAWNNGVFTAPTPGVPHVFPSSAISTGT